MASFFNISQKYEVVDLVRSLVVIYLLQIQDRGNTSAIFISSPFQGPNHLMSK